MRQARRRRLLAKGVLRRTLAMASTHERERERERIGKKREREKAIEADIAQCVSLTIKISEREKKNRPCPYQTTLSGAGPGRGLIGKNISAVSTRLETQEKWRHFEISPRAICCFSLANSKLPQIMRR